VAPNWKLNARDFATLESAARAADRLVALEAVVARDGLTTVGSTGQRRLHPAVGEIRLQRQLLAGLLAKVAIEPPPERTGRLSARSGISCVTVRRWLRRQRRRGLPRSGGES
jgi:hypothetical protein